MSRSYKQVEINLWANWQHIWMLFKGVGGGGRYLGIKQANTQENGLNYPDAF